MLHLTNSSLAGGGPIRWNEEELIACGDCADCILNLKTFFPPSSVQSQTAVAHNEIPMKCHHL